MQRKRCLARNMAVESICDAQTRLRAAGIITAMGMTEVLGFASVTRSGPISPSGCSSKVARELMRRV